MGKLQTEVMFNDTDHTFAFTATSGKQVIDQGTAETFLEARYLSMRKPAEAIAARLVDSTDKEDMTQEALCLLWSAFQRDANLATQTDSYIFQKMAWSIKELRTTRSMRPLDILAATDDVAYDNETHLTSSLQVKTFIDQLTSDRLHKVATMVCLQDMPKGVVASALGISNTRLGQHLVEIGKAWKAFTATL